MSDDFKHDSHENHDSDDRHKLNESIVQFIRTEFTRQAKPYIKDSLFPLFWLCNRGLIIAVVIVVVVLLVRFKLSAIHDARAFATAQEQGEFYLKQNDFDTALAHFNRMIELDANEPDGFYYRGYLNMTRLCDEGRNDLLENAIDDLARSIELGDEDEFAMLADAHFSLGKLYYYQDDMDSSIAQFSEAIRVYLVRHPDVQKKLELEKVEGASNSNTPDAQSSVEKTTKDKESSEEDKPIFSMALLWRSRAYAARNMIQKSLDDLRMAITFEETRPEAFAYLSRIHLIRNNLDKSLRALNNEIEIYNSRDPQNSRLGSAYMQRGHVQLLRQDYELAIADYKKALARHPDFGEARKYIDLAEWLLRQKNSQTSDISDMALIAH